MVFILQHSNSGKGQNINKNTVVNPGGQGVEPPVRACEKLAPVMGGIKVR